MLSAVEFNNQLCFERDEVCDVVANGVLPTEFDTEHLFAAQMLPKCLLGAGRVVSECLRATFIVDNRVGLMFHSIRLNPIPTLTLPLKGRELNCASL